MSMQYSRRTYRQGLCPEGMKSFSVTVKETDLWIAVDEEAADPSLPGEIEQLVWSQRVLLERYIKKDPLFRETLYPHVLMGEAPLIALEMVRAANAAGVGPMAAVAGAFAQLVGEHLLKISTQVIVENGGDLFLRCEKPLRVGVFAGSSPFSGKVALKVEPRQEPRGICTSSGSVGPSYSLGRADAAVIVARSAPLADAVATATANLVRGPEDMNKALKFALAIPGVEGAVVILKDRLAAQGDIQLQHYRIP